MMDVYWLSEDYLGETTSWSLRRKVRGMQTKDGITIPSAALLSRCAPGRHPVKWSRTVGLGIPLRAGTGRKGINPGNTLKNTGSALIYKMIVNYPLLQNLPFDLPVNPRQAKTISGL